VTAPIAAELGRLAAPTRGAPFDDVRLALLDAIVAAKGAGELDQASWEAAFAAAARSLRVRVLAEAEELLRSAAAHSRFPSRKLQSLFPDADAADRLLNQFLAAGMPLEQLAGLGPDPVSRRARGAALEASWEAAVSIAAAERARWRGLATQVAGWRRPTPTLWVLSALLLVAAVVLASWLSGVIAAPEWFRPVNKLWWRLWP
jgi:hypothetical protein